MKCKTNKLLAQAQALTALANVILSLNQLTHPTKRASQADEVHVLRCENLRLKNQNEYLKTAINSNTIMVSDLKIELLKLKIAREEWEQHNAGIGSPSFTAFNYSNNQKL